jgi:hypothetical protein
MPGWHVAWVNTTWRVVPSGHADDPGVLDVAGVKPRVSTHPGDAPWLDEALAAAVWLPSPSPGFTW